jgi:hypothetical protein
MAHLSGQICGSIQFWSWRKPTGFGQINAQLTKRMFLDYLESMLRFEGETKRLPTDRREWKGETVLLGTRSDKDAFKYFVRLLELYPNSQGHVFEEEGGHHMSFLFPKEYTRILSRYLE